MKFNGTKMKRMRTLENALSSILRILILVIGVIICIKAVHFSVYNNRIIYSSSRVSDELAGYKIVHISDTDNNILNAKSVIDREKPDLIVCTGNLTASNGDARNSLRLLANLAETYQTVYIPGLSDDKASVIEQLAQTKTKLALDNLITISGKDCNSLIEISGIGQIENGKSVIDAALENIKLDDSSFKVLLTNDLSQYDKLSEIGIDFVFSGGNYGKDTTGNGYKSGLYSKNGTALSLTGGTSCKQDSSLIFKIIHRPKINTIILSDGSIEEMNPIEKLLGYFIKDA